MKLSASYILQINAYYIYRSSTPHIHMHFHPWIGKHLQQPQFKMQLTRWELVEVIIVKIIVHAVHVLYVCVRTCTCVGWAGDAVWAMYEWYCEYSLIFFALTANATIEQMYPMTEDYCCHCPSITLRCTFPKNPLTASWTFRENGIPSQVTVYTRGHTVNASEVPSGILYLYVSNSSYLENNAYTCSAVYIDGGVRESVSAPFPIPRIEG